jgi:hypothetical protein
MTPLLAVAGCGGPWRRAERLRGTGVCSSGRASSNINFMPRQQTCSYRFWPWGTTSLKCGPFGDRLRMVGAPTRASSGVMPSLAEARGE